MAKPGKASKAGKSVRKTKTTTKQATAGHAALRKQLESQRLEILSLYEHDLRVGQQPSDEGSEDLVDRANASYNREFMFTLSDTERQILQEIDRALKRLDDGSYGRCMHCEEAIPKPRLQAVPWTRYCVDCQERVEQGVVFDA